MQWGRSAVARERERTDSLNCALAVDNCQKLVVPAKLLKTQKVTKHIL